MHGPTPTDRLSIDRLKGDDAEALYRYRSNPEVTRFQNWEPSSLDEVRDFIARGSEVLPDTPGKWVQYGLYLKESGELVGDCGIHVLDDDPRQVEIGITLTPDHQGNGLASEALQAVLGYLFHSLNKHRVFGSVDPRNKASIALLERVGMRQEAHFVQSYWFKGEWADDMIYAILKSEFSGSPGPS